MAIDEVQCDICNGSGSVPDNRVILHNVCPKCKGNRTLDWVTHAMGRSVDGIPSHSIKFSIVQHNIERLKNEICIQASMLGMRANIEIQIKDERIKYNFNPYYISNGG